MSTALAAIAASTALPPARATSAAASEASQCGVATANDMGEGLLIRSCPGESASDGSCCTDRHRLVEFRRPNLINRSLPNQTPWRFFPCTAY